MSACKKAQSTSNVSRIPDVVTVPQDSTWAMPNDLCTGQTYVNAIAATQTITLPTAPPAGWRGTFLHSGVLITGDWIFVGTAPFWGHVNDGLGGGVGANGVVTNTGITFHQGVSILGDRLELLYDGSAWHALGYETVTLSLIFDT